MRNQLILFEVLLTTATSVFTFFSVVTGIFGMNFKIPFSDVPSAFKWVIIITGTVGVIITCVLVKYLKHKNLLSLWGNYI